jgi:hypothetical protein
MGVRTGLCQETRGKIETAGIKFLRSVAEYSLYGYKTNEEI